MEPTQKAGRLRKGWGLTVSAWRVLKLDKELAVLPLLSFLTTIIGVALLVVLLVVVASHQHGHYQFPRALNIAVILVLYFVITLISNFFGGAVIYGATQRFHGEDPTVRSSLRGARRKLGPLAGFSLMMATVGLVLQALEDRVPFAGKIAVWLVNAAWSIANVFALPVIVLSEETVQPLEATKRSGLIIKQVWGESVVVDLGIGTIGALGVIGYILAGVAVGALLTVAHAPSVLILTMLIIGTVGLIGLALVLVTLSSIAKAALYHYAVTNETPQLFNQQLLYAAMTPKKARKIFA